MENSLVFPTSLKPTFNDKLHVSLLDTMSRDLHKSQNITSEAERFSNKLDEASRLISQLV